MVKILIGCRLIPLRRLSPCRSIMHVTQKSGNQDDHVYFIPKTSKPEHDKLLKMTTRSSTARSLLNNTIACFLPKGYPKSVSSDYTRFVILKNTSVVISAAGGVLATQSMLHAIGLGASALPLAAGLNWVIKDGLGQLGSVIFASVVSVNFDAQPKKWNMISTLCLETSSFIELLTPLWPHLFLPLAALANMGKNVACLSASASRAAIHRSFAIHQNLADVTVKSGSQTMAAAMIGMGIGVSAAAIIQNDPLMIGTMFVSCAVLNIVLTYKSLKQITLSTLTPGVYHHLLENYLQSGCLLQPHEVLAREAFLRPSNVFCTPIHVGACLDTAVASIDQLKEILTLFEKEQFIVSVRTHNRIGHVYLLLKEHAATADILRGLATAHVCSALLDEERQCQRYGAAEKSVSIALEHVKWLRDRRMSTRMDIITQALETVYSDKRIDDFIKACLSQDAWIVEDLILETRLSRLRFS